MSSNEKKRYIWHSISTRRALHYIRKQSKRFESKIKVTAELFNDIP